MLYSCTCRSVAVDWLLVPLKVNFFPVLSLFMLTDIPAQQSPVLAISWIREEHVRFGCHAWLRFCLWNWSCWWFFFFFWCANCLRFQAHNFRVWFGTMCKDLSVVGFELTTSWWFGQKRENLPNRPIDSAVRWVICLSPHLDTLCPGFCMRHATATNVDCDWCLLLTVYCQTIDCRSPVYINHCTSCCTAVPVDL